MLYFPAKIEKEMNNRRRNDSVIRLFNYSFLFHLKQILFQVKDC